MELPKDIEETIAALEKDSVECTITHIRELQAVVKEPMADFTAEQEPERMMAHERKIKCNHEMFKLIKTLKEMVAINTEKEKEAVVGLNGKKKKHSNDGEIGPEGR